MRRAPRRGTRPQRAEIADVIAYMELGASSGAGPGQRPTSISWPRRTSGARVADVVDDGRRAPLPRRHRSHRGRPRAARARRVIVDHVARRATVRAINPEVEASVSTAEPAMLAPEPAIQTFPANLTKTSSGLAAATPTFANEVMVHPTSIATVRRHPAADVPRYQLNLAHLIVRGPGAEHHTRTVTRTSAALARPHPEIQVASILRWSTSMLRTARARRSGKPPPGARPPARAPTRSSTWSSPPARAVRYLGSTIHFARRQLDRHERRRGATHQQDARLAPHRGEQLSSPSRPRRLSSCRLGAQEVLGYAVHDASRWRRLPRDGSRSAIRSSCSRPASWSRRATRAASSLSSPPACARAGVILLRD